MIRHRHVWRSIVVNGLHVWECGDCGKRALPNQTIDGTRLADLVDALSVREAE